LARPGTGSPAGLGRAHRWRRSQLRGPGYFKRLGPGIVTGAADDDPSGIGTYSQVGAAFGFGLLWTMLATLPLAVAVQEATASSSRGRPPLRRRGLRLRCRIILAPFLR
jgi:hypothetical protein